MVDVINPDSTDPLALSEGRDTTARRDTTTASQIDPSTATFEGGLNLRPDPEPLPVEVDTDLTNVSSNPNIPRVYPNTPANIIPPTELNLGAFQGDQALIDSIIRGSDLALADEVILNNQLSSVFNSGTPFGPNKPLFQEPDVSIPENPFPQLVSDTIEYRAEQAANNFSPVGIDPNTGEIVPGTRNALSGQPLSNVFQEFQQFAIGDTGTAFEESLPQGQPIRNLGRRFSDVFRGYNRAFQTNQGQRFLGRLDPVGIGNAIAPADRFTANLDALSERVVQPLAAFTGADFQPTQEFDQPDPRFLETLTQESLLTRDLFTGLSAGQQNDNFAPLQGRFNDFGNAGILSGLLYLANVPEGLFSGALYELTNFAIDNLTDRELPPDRVRLFDALRGRDLGFMNQADDARYLSFVDGDNQRGLLSRIGISNSVAQNAAGFVTDVIWGGFTDFGVSNISSRLARRVIDPVVARTLPLQTLDGSTVQSAVRNIIANSDIPPAQSIASINRLMDDALSAQSVRRQLPLRATPEVESIIGGSRRSLIIDADGIPLNVKVGPIRRALTGEIPLAPTVGIEAIDNLNIARLEQVEQSLLETQSAVTENLVRIEGARNNLRNIPEDASILNEFSNVQIELIRLNQSNNVALNNRINSLLEERRTLSFRTNRLNELITKEVNESVARQQTNLVGDVLETVSIDDNLNSIIPIIHPISIQESVPLSDVMQIYRADPINVLPTQLTLTRRTDEQLTELAKFHNIISPASPTLSSQHIRSLQSTHPNLLARYGNPIDNNLASPVKRIEINPPNAITREPQRSIIADVTPTTSVPTELPAISNITVNSLNRRRQRLLNKLSTAKTITEENRIARQLRTIDRRVNDIVSQSSVESVNNLYINSLPRQLTPQSSASRQLASDLAQAESVYKESTEAARRLHQQLIQAQDVVQEQGRILEELPALERRTLQHEVATRNNFVPNNDGIPTIASSGPTRLNLDPEAGIDVPSRPLPDDDSPVQSTRRFDPDNPEAGRTETPEEIRNRTVGTATTDSGFVNELPSELINQSDRIPRREVADILTPEAEGTVVAISGAESFAPEGVAYRWGRFTGQTRQVRGNRIQYQFESEFDDPVTRELSDLIQRGPENYDLRRANELYDTLRQQGRLDPNFTIEGQLSFAEFNNIGPLRSPVEWVPDTRIHAVRQTGVETPDASTAILDVPAREVVDIRPPVSLEAHLSNNGVWYHGTKSRVNDFSTIDYSLGSSVTNELGPGLYLTTDPGLGEVFAKAQPVVDRNPNPSLRSTDIGEVVQINVTTDPSNFIDASKVVDADSPIRSLFIELVRDRLSLNLSPVLRNRLISNVRNMTRKSPYQSWFHRLRAQWIRLRPDSQSDLIRFYKDYTNTLSISGTPGAFYKDSSNHLVLALYNDGRNPLPIRELRRTSVGTGQPEEQVLNRYAADLFAHNEIGDRTTKANLEASRLNVDTSIVRNLQDATKEAYTQSLNDAQRMISIQNDLDEVVRRETNQQISDINTNGPRDATNRLRRFRGDNNSPCI